MLSKSIFALVCAFWFSSTAMHAFQFVLCNFGGMPIASQDDLYKGHSASQESATPWESLFHSFPSH
jgi:hypothetical protein